MIEELANLQYDFPEKANRKLCFIHILSLVAKCIIKQFDVPKAQADEMLDDTAKKLPSLAVDLDIEERISREGQSDKDDGSDDEGDVDKLDGWGDVRGELSDEERLRKTAFSIHSPSTVLGTDPEHITGGFCGGLGGRTSILAYRAWRSVPATSVEVERVFCMGRILLSHVRGRLSVQSSVSWVAVLLDLKDGGKEEPLANDWDSVT
ncbi:hypothetical protein GALMADRAFT_144097 [Galerina marginata CBS 339.88]|uniref:HAT C-terminal dimerisation domain-containing protein n=1 Tax=Galerina marginata (strain CBS 339.88) TaxID=685588 RepID=A0A067SJF7_GALM3|nr:hypothetical protein GALMADRAFT_144097 [Galerina marginata CBS 339.88]